MTSSDLIGTAAVARLLKVDRRVIVRMVHRGELTPAAKLPGRTGALLFAAAYIDRVRRDKLAGR